MERPKKAENLYLERLESELCVYDWERKMVHALNPTAASVLEMCDGQTSVARMAARLEQELNVPQAQEVVWLSLAELEQADLLAGQVGDSKTLSRREMLKAMGVAVALLPVVSSIVAPTPAQAQTCVPNCIAEASLGEYNSCQELWDERALEEWQLCSYQLVSGEVLYCLYEFYDPEGCNIDNRPGSFELR